MTTAADTANHLLLVIDNLEEKYAEWAEGGHSYVTQEFELAVNETLEVFAGSDMPERCKTLAKGVEALETFWNKYQQEAEQALDVNILPGNGFFKSLEGILMARNAARPSEKKVIESIPTLEKQGVNDFQICKIYDWLDEEGRPQYWKLAEERAEPGKYTKNHVPLAERRRLISEAKRREIFERLSNQRKMKLEAATRPGPEPWEELLTQPNISASQIANIKRCHVDEVFAKADELGLPRPPLNFNAMMLQGEFDRQPALAEDKRVLDATNTGLPKLREIDPTLPARQVEDESPEPTSGKRKPAAKSKAKAKAAAPKARKPVTVPEEDDVGDDDADDPAAGSMEDNQDAEIMDYAAAGMDVRQIQQAMLPAKVKIDKIQAVLRQRR